MLDVFDRHEPSLVVTTHPMMPWDYEVVMTARRLGIRTIGVLKSWDNIRKGLVSRPDELSVWNRVNREEAIRMQAYLPSEVAMNGAPSFDPYFDEEWHLERSRFLPMLGLDPARPMVTYATCGVDRHGYLERDETHLADALLRMFDSTPKLRDAQLLIRLHPTSRLESFSPFVRMGRVAVSFASYLPAIGWCPSRSDLVFQTNILKHSDVVVTPASSWSIEAAIFNTPTVAPVYSDIQPLHAKVQFADHTLREHFRPLVEHGWVPICYSYEECRAMLAEAIEGRQWFKHERGAIVDEYVQFRDSKSCARVAAWIAQRASGGGSLATAEAVPGSGGGDVR
jgi:hypothetical protein